MAVFGHSGSHAPQLMHSLVIVVAIDAESSRVSCCSLTTFGRTFNSSGRRPRRRSVRLGGVSLAMPQRTTAVPPRLHGAAQIRQALDAIAVVVGHASRLVLAPNDGRRDRDQQLGPIDR